MALQHRDQVVRRPGKIESFFKCESLEQRQLLTTLHGGEVFEFFDPEDPGTDRDDRRVIRVAIQGQGTIELVGGIIDDQNNLIVAEKDGRAGRDREAVLKQIAEIKAMFGIERHYLEGLLGL